MLPKEEIIALRQQGWSYGKIAKELNIHKASVAWTVKHPHTLARDDTYDWAVVQAYYDDNHGVVETIQHFQMSNASWSKALKRGAIKAREKVKIPIEELLVSDRPQTSRGHLKTRLIEEGLLSNQCAKCGLKTEWQGELLVLHLEHINGIGTDNRIENLCLLCPNCHSQTATYAGRNCKNKLPLRFCQDCNMQISTAAKRCINCANRANRKKSSFGAMRKNKQQIEIKKPDGRRSVVWPSASELQRLLWEKPTTQIAKDFGVSDKAVEKWAKAYNLSKPPRGYWAKQKSRTHVATIPAKDE